MMLAPIPPLKTHLGIAKKMKFSAEQNFPVSL
jgi:hypothetical protein